MVVVQNKIDIVSRERAVENWNETRKFVKGTVAEKAPIIPLSAQHKLNIDLLIEALEKNIPTPKRDPNAPPRMYVLRSFDVNKPGTEVEDLVGGVVGGSIVQGVFKVGEEVEIRPGLRVESSGKPRYEPLITAIRSLQVGKGSVKEARSGGLVGMGTLLDPSITRADGLVGSIAGKVGTLPETLDKLSLEVELFERAIGTEQMVPVDKIRTNEPLVLNIGTSVTSGIVLSARESIADVELKKPVAVDAGFRVAVSRRVGESWRLIGYGTVKA